MDLQLLQGLVDELPQVLPLALAVLDTVPNVHWRVGTGEW
jgi:hypothetical protein